MEIDSLNHFFVPYWFLQNGFFDNLGLREPKLIYKERAAMDLIGLVYLCQ
jgi:hypothetical protein